LATQPQLGIWAQRRVWCGGHDYLNPGNFDAARAALITDLGRPQLPDFHQEGDVNKLLLVLIAILLPPLAVGLKAGIGFHLFLNIVLTLLVYLPGLLHALWIVLKD
jgi:uncharacterized membrane protein YqaE (UPF0057 family)